MPPVRVALPPLPPHRRSATDAVPAPGGHTFGSDPRQYQNGARRSVVRSLLDTALRDCQTSRHLRNRDSAPAVERRLVHRCATEWGGMRAGRSPGLAYGPAAWDGSWVLRGNAALLVACQLAARH